MAIIIYFAIINNFKIMYFIIYLIIIDNFKIINYCEDHKMVEDFSTHCRFNSFYLHMKDNDYFTGHPVYTYISIIVYVDAIAFFKINILKVPSYVIKFIFIRSFVKLCNQIQINNK